MNDRFKFRVWDIGRENYIDNPNLNWFNGYLGGEIGCCIVLNDILHKISTDGRFILEQCTGLKDKNGNLIYEGDIVKIPEDWDEYGWMAGEEREIYFRAGGFRFKPKEHCFPKNARGHWLEDDGEFEIIGNIHEQKDNK